MHTLCIWSNSLKSCLDWMYSQSHGWPELSYTRGVTLKSDPVEKWLSGSFFNVKNDSPSHFSTLKADPVQMLTLNFEPKVVKKWLPPWNFDLQGGGSFFNDFSTLKKSLYTPLTKFWRYTGITSLSVCLPACLPACLSVCPSVKKCFLYNNYSSIWHTMMILHIYVDLDLRRTSIDCGSKVQRSNLDLSFSYFTNSLPQD